MKKRQFKIALRLSQNQVNMLDKNALDVQGELLTIKFNEIEEKLV